MSLFSNWICSLQLMISESSISLSVFPLDKVSKSSCDSAVLVADALIKGRGFPGQGEELG